MITQEAERLLDPFRPYLTVLAELHLDRKLRGKLDPSDIVQQSFLRAYSALAEVRSPEPEVLAAWLRKILASTLADAVKHYERDKRAVALERLTRSRHRPFRLGVRRLAGRRPELAERPRRAKRRVAPPA